MKPILQKAHSIEEGNNHMANHKTPVAIALSRSSFLCLLSLPLSLSTKTPRSPPKLQRERKTIKEKQNRENQVTREKGIERENKDLEMIWDKQSVERLLGFVGFFFWRPIQEESEQRWKVYREKERKHQSRWWHDDMDFKLSFYRYCLPSLFRSGIPLKNNG